MNSEILAFSVKFRRLTEWFLTVLFMLCHGVSQAQSPGFGQGQLIQHISQPVGHTSILLSYPQGGAMLVERNRSIVITEQGGVFVFKYASKDEQWVVDDTLQLPKGSRQKRRVVKSPDEQCLFVSGDGGDEGYDASFVTSLYWEDEQLVLGSEQGFNGVVEQAVSPESTFLVACSPKSGVMRVYRIKDCSLEQRNEFVAGQGRYGFLEGCHGLAFSDDGRLFCVGGSGSHRIGCFSLDDFGNWSMKQELSQYGDNERLKEPMALTFLNDILYIVLKKGLVVAYERQGVHAAGGLGFSGKNHELLCNGRRVYPKTESLEDGKVGLLWRPFRKEGVITPVNHNTLLIADSMGVHTMEWVNGFLEFRRTIIHYLWGDSWRLAETGLVSSPEWLMMTDSANHSVTLFPVIESSAESLRSPLVSIYLLLPLMLVSIL